MSGDNPPNSIIVRINHANVLQKAMGQRDAAAARLAETIPTAAQSLDSAHLLTSAGAN